MVKQSADKNLWMLRPLNVFLSKGQFLVKLFARPHADKLDFDFV